MRSIAFIDFDGTLYKGDSMLDFIKFCHGGTKLWLFLIITSPWIILKKIGAIPSQNAKERLLSLAFKGKDIGDIRKRAKEFSVTLDDKLYAKAQAKLDAFKSSNVEVVIVSASCELWLADWCSSHGFKLIASIEEIVEDKFTGKLKSKNCKGVEKVVRIKAEYDLSVYTKIFAYGNDSSDLPMIELSNQATEALYK